MGSLTNCRRIYRAYMSMATLQYLVYRTLFLLKQSLYFEVTPSDLVDDRLTTTYQQKSRASCLNPVLWVKSHDQIKLEVA